MSTMKKKIMSMDLSKSLRILCIIAICIAAISAVFSALAFDEVWNYESGWYGYAPLQIEHGTAAMVISTILITSGAVVALLIYINMSMWIYQAVVEAQMHAGLWLFLAVWGHIFTFAVFLIIRSIIRKKCPSCSANIRNSDRYCPECGPQFRKECRECGCDSNPGSRYCSSCGANLR